MSAFVPCLFDARRPATVVGRVWTVVVRIPIYRFALWARTHVRIEGFERVSPPIAHRNTSASIVAIRRGFRVVAAISNIDPCFIFASVSHAVRRMVRSIAGTTIALGTLLAPKAPATLAASVPKSRAVDWLFASTGTPTQPLTTERSECRPTSKRLAGYVDKLRHFPVVYYGLRY